MRRDGTDDAFSDLILQLEDVVERAFEALRPEVRSGRRIDQLPGDAHPVTGPAHAAFQHVTHAELLADTLDVHGAAFVREAGIARDHEQPTDPRQGSDDVLHHAVGEIFLLRVAAQVLEGQDGDRGFVRQHEGFIPVGGHACVDIVSVRLPGLGGLACLDLANEAVTLARHRANQALFLTGIADGLAHRIDVAGDRRFRNHPAAPHCPEQVILADDAIALADELQQ
ncbi:hypothetical protein D3C84_668000 [compost metagenome]